LWRPSGLENVRFAGHIAAMPITKEQLDVVLRVFDDIRALIAAGKVQRWEVLKWAATLNIALAAAAAGFKRSPAAFFMFAVVIAGFGIGLIFYYNLRMTRTRARLPLMHQFIRDNVIDLKETVGLEYGMVKGTDYDTEEMHLFTFIIAFSIVPTFVIWVFS
jgi:hypothetical protein